MQKYLKFLFGIVVLMHVRCEANMEKFEAMINQTLEECRVAENASVEDTMILYTDDTSWPETKEGKCLIECFFEEVGIVSKNLVAFNQNNFFLKFKFKNHKFYKRGFLSLALMLDEIEDDDTEKIEAFNEIVEIINEECGKLKSTNRCDAAVDVAKCLVRIMETDFIEKNSLSDHVNYVKPAW